MSRRQIKLTVPPKLHEAISNAADANGLPLSTFVREITKDWIEAKLDLHSGGVKSKISQISELKNQIKNLSKEVIDNSQDIDEIEKVTTNKEGSKEDLVLLSELLKKSDKNNTDGLSVNEKSTENQKVYRNSKDGDTDISLGEGSGNQINITIRLDK